MSRTATLLLVDAAGRDLGRLPPFIVDVPWWPEVADVVAGARERYGVAVTVLRILATEPGRQNGGAVTYQAQADGPVALRRAAGGLGDEGRDAPPGDQPGVSGPRSAPTGWTDDHPLRAAYARPGGPAASLRWANLALDRVGRGPLLGAEQRKTWNLSAIWRLRTPVGPVWLKEVPRFFAHEPAVLGWLAEAGLGEAAVPVLAADGTRMLLEHVDGADLHDAGLATRLAIAADMHAIHLDACARVHSLLGPGAGVPDQRGPQLARVVSAVAAGPGRGNEELARLLNGLEGRLAAAAACGLPETLIHGDLHPGNVRGTAGRRVIIDWGDSCIAHPAYDIMRLAEGLSATDASELVSFWAGLWRAVRPGSDPGAAVELLRPVAALRNAAIYANFLANIEPDEHPYHARDVGFWLERAAESVEVTGLSR